jgi:hypothetical protein
MEEDTTHLVHASILKLPGPPICPELGNTPVKKPRPTWEGEGAAHEVKLYNEAKQQRVATWLHPLGGLSGGFSVKDIPSIA